MCLGHQSTPQEALATYELMPLKAPSLVLPASSYTLDLSIHRGNDSPVDGLFPGAQKLNSVKLITFLSLCMCAKSPPSCLSATPRTVVHQAPLSMGFPRQEYRSGLPSPSSEDHSDLGIEPTFPALQKDSLSLSQKGNPWIAFGHADM